jgi:hypothetical protein
MPDCLIPGFGTLRIDHLVLDFNGTTLKAAALDARSRALRLVASLRC